MPVNQSIYQWKHIALQCSGDFYTSQYILELNICITLVGTEPCHFCVWFISLRAEFFVPECHLFCFVFHLGLCFHAFPIIINALIVYFTEKLISWEFTDELLLLLGAVIMRVMYKLLLRDCAVWAPANGGVIQCFLKRNTLAAKKEKKNLLVMLLELSQRSCSWCETHGCNVASFFCVITVRVQLFCSSGGGVINFGKDFFP